MFIVHYKFDPDSCGVDDDAFMLFDTDKAALDWFISQRSNCLWINNPRPANEMELMEADRLEAEEEDY